MGSFHRAIISEQAKQLLYKPINLSVQLQISNPFLLSKTYRTIFSKPQAKQVNPFFFPQSNSHPRKITP